MKMYLFEYLNEVSGNYHSEGGLVVIAKDKQQVYDLIDKEDYIKISEDEWQKVYIFKLKEDVEPRIFVFPDAGCC